MVSRKFGQLATVAPSGRYIRRPFRPLKISFFACPIQTPAHSVGARPEQASGVGAAWEDNFQTSLAAGNTFCSGQAELPGLIARTVATTGHEVHRARSSGSGGPIPTAASTNDPSKPPQVSPTTGLSGCLAVGVVNGAMDEGGCDSFRRGEWGVETSPGGTSRDLAPPPGTDAQGAGNPSVS